MIVQTSNPSELRLVRERWYHRLLDKLTRKPEPQGVLIGTVSFDVFMGSDGKIFTKRALVNVGFGVGSIVQSPPSHIDYITGMPTPPPDSL